MSRAEHVCSVAHLCSPTHRRIIAFSFYSGLFVLEDEVGAPSSKLERCPVEALSLFGFHFVLAAIPKTKQLIQAAFPP